jgi:hypothetical protein
MIDMNYEPNEQDKLKAAIENIIRENLYLYVLEIDYNTKEIIVCLTEKLLWNMIPMNPEFFLDLRQNFSGYEITELDENVARVHGDRNSLLNPN